MQRVLHLILLSLTLLTATACSTDKDSEPAPALEGRWNFERSQTYSAQGTLLPIPLPGIIPAPHYLEVHGTQMSKYLVGSTATVVPTYVYDASQSTLVGQDGIISRIEELTKNTLRIRTPTFVASQGPITDPVVRYDVVAYYTR